MTLLEVLKDAHARSIRACEAIRDGDLELAQLILDDLGADIWAVVERIERGRS